MSDKKLVLGGVLPAPQWRDATSYSRDRDEVPSWWKLRVASLIISVGNKHIYYPKGDTWLMNCEPWFRTHELKAKNEPDAKSEAVGLVVQKIAEIQAAIHGMRGT